MQYKPGRRKLSSADWFLIRWLVFCFPIGLMMLWRKRCRWPRWRKCTITVGIAGLVLLIMVPQTAPPDRLVGGMRVVSLSSQMAEVMGPEKPEGLTAESALLIRAGIPQPSPTPMPELDIPAETEAVMVFINDGGKYYHIEPCRYIYNHTPSYELTARIASLYEPCKDCDAPEFQ